MKISFVLVIVNLIDLY